MPTGTVRSNLVFMLVQLLTKIVQHNSADFQGKATTHAFMLYDKNDTIVVSFRDTETFAAESWSSNVDLSWYEIDGIGNIHAGFMKALGLLRVKDWPQDINNQTDNRPAALAYYAIREELREFISRNNRAKSILTGHSLGDAVAILFAAILAFHEETELLERLEGVYTFGQPRVGDKKSAEFMTNKLKENAINYARFVYSNDVVARLPFDNSELMFKHFGQCLHFNSFYKAKVSYYHQHVH